MSKTKIQWASHTWNPVTGCTKISEGCLNCYAERIARRFYSEPFEVVKTHPDRLSEPWHWKNPRRVFVCSMGDLFHEDVPDDFIESVLCSMVYDIEQVRTRHIFMILTKRPARMFEYLSKFVFPSDAPYKWPLDNVWLGVTAENQEMADERIPILLQTPAVVRFVSVEPMLEKMDLSYPLHGYPEVYASQPDGEPDWQQTTPPLDWVICGAESGPGARPFDMDWARDLKNQCEMASIPFFFKQGRIDGQLVKMPELDGRVWDQYPEAK
jgi:protein gp37